ncbi:MAG: ABC transporter ATP-binding protein [Candidatus Micrarchaeia archaeon]
MEEPIIRLEHVWKEYRGEVPFVAIKDLSLEICRGELISILGPSGSGKSTLLHLIGLLDTPTSGEIYICGKPSSHMSTKERALLRRKTIGFVFQAFNLAPTLTVFENVELPLIISEVPRDKRREIVLEKLRVVGLSDKLSNKPSQLSGGEKQRVAIARSLANNPSILLADEPTGNLDSASSAEVIEFILNLWKEQHITVIFVTHDSAIASHTNRIIRIRDGCIESDTKKAKNEKGRCTI